MDWSAFALLLMTLPTAAGEPTPAEPIQFAQVMVREQILIRVPGRARGRQARAVSAPVNWKESRGPKCLSMRTIAAATLLSQNSFDLVLRDRSRIRAKLEKSCPALDYYYGFYIRQTPDGQICADRDSIRSRMGGQCGIERFRTLKAEKRE
jgi:hypothetical protein